MWFIYIFLLVIQVPADPTTTPIIHPVTISNETNTTEIPIKTTKSSPVPEEGRIQNKTGNDKFYCTFGKILPPRKYCNTQQECQSKMNINAYCSVKEMCCQDDSDEFNSLCYDRRLPLFGEKKCNSESKCEIPGALCKSGHCCPNFRYIANEPLRPPSHFYTSNFSCIPGEPIMPGFQFAFCSNISRTIAYLGVVDKCGQIQHISKYSRCQRDSDCFPGGVCVWIVDEGTCFRNPETCSKRTKYDVAIGSCYMSFVMMILYFLTKACYEHPVKISNMIPILALQLYSVTKEAEREACDPYKIKNMNKEEIKMVVQIASEAAWKEEERSIKRPATEYILNWFGYVVDYSDDESEDMEEEDH